MTHERSWLARLAAVLFGLVLALTAALAWTLTREGRTPAPDQPLLGDEALREEALRTLVSTGAGVWDSHQDPDVGRILQPEIEDRDYAGASISSNSFGMREREYGLRKPEETVRIVLLGDSYVFGYGVPADRRLGVFLESSLRERKTSADEVEVLHLAIASWNVRAASAYLRRQLSLLQPDLVVHVTVTNDLDDTKGLRGFGSVAGYSPQVRDRANGLVSARADRGLVSKPARNHLPHGLDAEGRGRYEDLAAEIAQLAQAVEGIGGQYVHLGAWEEFNPVLRPFLEAVTREEQRLWLPASFSADRENVNSRRDPHWNERGHRAVARLIESWIEASAVLETLALAPLEASSALLERGRQGARGAVPRPELVLRSTVDLSRLDERDVAQIYGGLDEDGLVAPYASLVLRNENATELSVEGARLGRPELTGEVRVSLEGLEVGRLELAGDAAIDARFAIPESLRDRPFLNLRFTSTDFVYARVRRGKCVCFTLERAAVR